MMRFVMPIILTGIGVAILFVFTNPIYSDVKDRRTKVASFNQALDNAKALENERDKLTVKSNSIDPDDLIKINKLLPGSIDNIRLILEIGQIALPYGMTLQNVSYNATEETTSPSAKPGEAETVSEEAVAQSFSNKDYGTWDLSFSTTGTYANFLNFTRDLQKNLRIVDIASIQFSSSSGGTISSIPGSPSPTESYTYSFKIKTYWLKN